MDNFVLKMQSATASQDIEGVTSFLGEDASGSFGILAGHARMMTCLVTGLARFRIGENPWRYLAMPGAVLYFHNNVLTISTRKYLLDDDCERISELLREQIMSEEEKLRQTKRSLYRMEEELLKRLWKMGRTA